MTGYPLLDVCVSTPTLELRGATDEGWLPNNCSHAPS
jgi:hypothetical protein